MDKKNTMLLTVIAVATLLVAVVGATFAYFTASNSATGATNVTTTTEKVGAVVVSNPTGSMHLNLTAAQMAIDTKGTSYYATNAEDKYSATAVNAPIAKLEATGGVDSTEYTVSFNIDVVKSSIVQTGDAEVTFTLAEGVTMAGVTSGTAIDYAELANEYKVSYTQTGNTTGVQLVSVAIKFNNTNAEQDYLAGQTLTTSFTNADIDVKVK